MRKILAVLIGVGIALVGATPAVPATLDAETRIQCSGTNVIKYHPGLTYTERTVTISGRDSATDCTDSANPDQQLSFEATFAGRFTTSCASLFTGGTGTQELLWNTGETSKWAWTLRFSNNASGQVIATADGPLTHGKYAGAELRQVITQTSDFMACSTSQGLKETGGPSNWTITSAD